MHPAVHKHLTTTHTPMAFSPAAPGGGALLHCSLTDEGTEAALQRRRRGQAGRKESTGCLGEKSNVSPGGPQQGTARQQAPLKTEQKITASSPARGWA